MTAIGTHSEIQKLPIRIKQYAKRATFPESNSQFSFSTQSLLSSLPGMSFSPFIVRAFNDFQTWRFIISKVIILINQNKLENRS